MTKSLPRMPAAASLLLVLPLLALAGCSSDDSATTHLEIRFSGERPDATYTVKSDVDSRPTAAMYERDGVPHPDVYTVHDQLEDWSRQTGKAYATTSYPDTGFGAGYFLTGLDGVNADGSSAYWALIVDGEESTVGMSQAQVVEGGTVVWQFTRVSASSLGTGGGPALAIDPPASPTREETIVLTGTATPGSYVAFDAHDATRHLVGPDGRWSLERPIDYGTRILGVRADDNFTITRAAVPVVRLAPATFEAVFTAEPGHPATSHEVWFNPDQLSAAPMYAGTDTDRATAYSVHDLMVDWTAQTGIPVEYGGPGAFGFSVDSIDGVGQPLDSSLPPYWCYTLNGESATLGISLQTVAPLDVVVWEYSTCV